MVSRKIMQNKILIIVLGLLLVNLCREYILTGFSQSFRIESSAVEKPTVKSLVTSDFNIQKKDWGYYQDIFTQPLHARAGFTDEKTVLPSRRHCLPMVLKGTVISNPSKSFAIIEDLNTGIQDLYGLGDTVCDAKIIAMNRNRVTLEYNGNKQELRMFEDKMAEDYPRPSLLCRAEAGIKEPAVDFTKLLTQVRIKPYFESGRCVGFQLSSIRNGSLVERIGLKEGDIIETVNGVKVDDPLKALQLLYTIERNNPVYLGIERHDEKIELDCRVES